MSMLAGPRRKQKVINLRAKNNAWSNDTNKFGQRMLEKMGWSSGKGLGAKEDGIVEHVVARYKNDEKGLGYEDRNDQWTRIEDDYNALLSSLSGISDSGNEGKLHSGVSLEEKSKNTKSRIHYHKFTRGKDVTRYSEKDLASIFGKKSLKKEEKSEPDKEDVKITEQIFTEKGSMDDYFKSKISSIKSKGIRIDVSSLDASKDNNDFTFQGFVQNNETMEEDSHTGLGFQPFSSYPLTENNSIDDTRKTLKKSQSLCKADNTAGNEIEQSEHEQNKGAITCNNLTDILQTEVRGKKKKKNFLEGKEIGMVPDNDVPTAKERKKKKVKKSKETSYEKSLDLAVEVANSDCKKKKRKTKENDTKSNQNQDLKDIDTEKQIFDTSLMVIGTNKKRKGSKRIYTSIELDQSLSDTTVNIATDTLLTDTNSKKKKKIKKKAISCDEIVQNNNKISDDIEQQENNENQGIVTEKSSKKLKKKKNTDEEKLEDDKPLVIELSKSSKKKNKKSVAAESRITSEDHVHKKKKIKN